MSDLILGDPNETNENEEIENEVEFTTDLDYITAAYFALSAIEGIDEMQFGRNSITQQRIKRIRRKALIIIDECLNSLYDEIIDGFEDE